MRHTCRGLFISDVRSIEHCDCRQRKRIIKSGFRAELTATRWRQCTKPRHQSCASVRPKNLQILFFCRSTSIMYLTVASLLMAN